MTLIQTTICDTLGCTNVIGDYIGDGWVRIPEGQTAWLCEDRQELHCRIHGEPTTDHEVDGEVKVF